jgi:hypothetical protein
MALRGLDLTLEERLFGAARLHKEDKVEHFLGDRFAQIINFLPEQILGALLRHTNLLTAANSREPMIPRGL